MLTAAQSADTDSRVLMDSTYDMGFGDSDDDNFSSEDDCEDVSETDYWFGKKYFECVAAQHLLHHQGFTGDVAAIDVSHPVLASSLRHSKLTNEVPIDHHAASISLSASATATLGHI